MFLKNVLQDVCPVCRETITIQEDTLHFTPPDKEQELQFTASEDMKIWQMNMAARLQKQKENDGIIDVEAEKNKFLFSLNV